MDPDLPLPSIEHDASHVAGTPNNNFTNFRDRTGTPLASATPNRSQSKTPASHAPTPGPLKSSRSPSLNGNERRSTSNLHSPRSSSSLSVSRGQTPSKLQLRRVSSNLNPASLPTNMKSPEYSPPAPITAESVAREYFSQELKAHEQSKAKTAVFVHDSCYGHRFSRPRTSKAALSTIVERPERILATLLGVSTAYVRLGERHSDGAHGPHPGKNVTNGPDPPFIFNKTTRSIAFNHPAVTHVHGTKWMEELQIMCDSAEAKLAMNGKELQRPVGYGRDDKGNTLPKLHEGDLYLCSESLSALQGCLGGVCDAVDAVFSPSSVERAFVCIRPPGHHCSSNYPSGFCWLNNVHVGISYAAMNHGLTHAAIFDFDLHHGDGSQTITWDHNRDAQSVPKNAAQHRKTPISYYSLHDINSYPCEWGDEEKVRNASLCIENAHGQSIWNVHLEPWTSLEHFWQLYETKYMKLLEKAESFLQHHSHRLRDAGVKPRAAIFLSAGFDASQWEGQGMQRHNVNVPTEFYARFTSDVVKLAHQVDLGVEGRVISVLEGGYSDRALTSGVLSHLCGLVDDTASVSSGPETEGATADGLINSIVPYEPVWWHEASLKVLEDRVAGIISSPPKTNDKAPGNYSSPTQASTARMTNVARERHSLSTQLESRLLLENYDPGPPPPVDWVTASYELSRILIPSDRQTLSCRHEELNAEATKARRERQSAIGVAAPTEPRMQLRTRGKAPVAEPEVVRASSRTSNRRTTIAAVSELPDPSMVSQRPRRRSSAASSILSSFQDMKLDEGSAPVSGQSHLTQKAVAALDNTKDLVSKKTKMAPPPKKAAARISSPRKIKEQTLITSKIAPLQQRLDAGKGQSNGQTPVPVSQPDHTAQTGSLVRDSMDDLANGMKRVSIKLNMPTPEQHAENQKKAEEAKPKKPRVTRKPPVPKVAKPKATKTSDAAPVTYMTQSAASMKQETVSTELPDTIVTNAEPITASESNEPGRQEVEHQSKLNTVVSYSSNSVQPQSEDGNANLDMNGHDIADSQGPKQQLPTYDTFARPHSQSTKTNDSKISQKTRADLPVFTSSSPIPFASTLGQDTRKEEHGQQTSSIWDVPDTPKH